MDSVDLTLAFGRYSLPELIRLSYSSADQSIIVWLLSAISEIIDSI